MNYLKKTFDVVRIIGLNIVEEFFKWVDEAYVIHDYMKIQTGGKMSFGHETAHRQPINQKLNTKSSTKSKLVGTSEYFPFNVWVLIFMGKKGYAVKKKSYSRLFKAQLGLK